MELGICIQCHNHYPMWKGTNVWISMVSGGDGIHFSEAQKMCLYCLFISNPNSSSSVSLDLFYKLAKKNAQSQNRLHFKNDLAQLREKTEHFFVTCYLLPGVLVNLVLDYIDDNLEIWNLFLGVDRTSLNQKKVQQCLWFVPSQSPIETTFTIPLPFLFYDLIALSPLGHLISVCQRVKKTNSWRFWTFNLREKKIIWSKITEIRVPEGFGNEKDMKFEQNESQIIVNNNKKKQIWVAKKELKYNKFSKVKEKEMEFFFEFFFKKEADVAHRINQFIHHCLINPLLFHLDLNCPHQICCHNMRPYLMQVLIDTLNFKLIPLSYEYHLLLENKILFTEKLFKYSARHLKDPKIRIEILKQIKEFSVQKLCFMFLMVWGDPRAFFKKNEET